MSAPAENFPAHFFFRPQSHLLASLVLHLFIATLPAEFLLSVVVVVVVVCAFLLGIWFLTTCVFFFFRLLACSSCSSLFFFFYSCIIILQPLLDFSALCRFAAAVCIGSQKLQEGKLTKFFHSCCCCCCYEASSYMWNFFSSLDY